MPSPTVVEGLPQAVEGTQQYGNRFFFMNVLMSPSVVTLSTTAEQSITVTGLIATDMVVSINKPTTQAGLLLANGRVSAANTLKLTFANDSTVSVTPTASENYLLLIYRPNV